MYVASTLISLVLFKRLQYLLDGRGSSSAPWSRYAQNEIVLLPNTCASAEAEAATVKGGMRGDPRRLLDLVFSNMKI